MCVCANTVEFTIARRIADSAPGVNREIFSWGRMIRFLDEKAGGGAIRGAIFDRVEHAVRACVPYQKS